VREIRIHAAVVLVLWVCLPPSSSASKAGESCLAGTLMEGLGRDRLMLGGMFDDKVASRAPFDVRYLYLSGGLADSKGPCARCGDECRNDDWWGCWQDPSAPPGKYVRDFVGRSRKQRQLPFITYYEWLHLSGVEEGAAEVEALRDQSLMARYFADFRFMLQQLGGERALVHLEPDLWGYAQQTGKTPAQIPAAVETANVRDCAGHPDTLAGLGRCLIKMVRTYAPAAKVGLHASAWSTNLDVMQNRDPALEVALHARKTAAFLREAGAGEGDFIVVEASDRDAGFYSAQGKDRWWDASDATLPNFVQAFAWAKALSEELRLPNLWWQLPLGHARLANQVRSWRDNRVEYFFSHPERVVQSHGVGMLFGAGASNQTDPSSDRGHFVAHAKTFLSGKRPRICPRPGKPSK
jgi:hypothetical protein